MKCHSCGTELELGAEYCTNCGAKQAGNHGDGENMHAEPDFGGKKDGRDSGAVQTNGGGSAYDARLADKDGGNVHPAQTNGGGSGRRAKKQRTAAEIASAEKKANIIFIAIVGLIVLCGLIGGYLVEFEAIFPNRPLIKAENTSATVSTQAIDITYTYSDLSTRKTNIVLTIDNAHGNIALPNGERTYEFKAEIMRDGEKEKARITLALGDWTDGKVVTCRVNFTNGKQFETAYFSFPLVINGESVVCDVQFASSNWVKINP